MAFITTKTMARTRGTDSATTMPVRSQGRETDEQHNRQRFDEGMHELSDCVLDDSRLIGDLLEIESAWYCRHEVCGGAASGRSHFKNIGALRHHDADADGRLVLLPHHKIRRIGKAVCHRCDIASRKTRRWLQRASPRRLAPSRAPSRAAAHASRSFHDASGTTAFCLARIEYLVSRNAKRGELGVRKLDVDLLRLRTVEIDLGDVLHQQALPQRFSDFFHLHSRAIGGEHVEIESTSPYSSLTEGPMSPRQVVLMSAIFLRNW